MKKKYYSLGLMSGTSMDGVDASIIQSDGKAKYRVILDKYFKYSKEIYENLINLRDKIKIVRDETRTLDLKKESLNDKVEMQTNWIKELESQSKGRIDDNQQKITTLFTESDDYLSVNEQLENDVFDLTKQQEVLI